MFITTPVETRKVLQGKVAGLSRIYGGMCPHQPGTTITLAYESPQGERVPYAQANILGVYNEDYKGRAQSTPIQDHLAQGEGFSNSIGWSEHFKILYGKAPAGIVSRLAVAVTVHPEKAKEVDPSAVIASM